MLLPSLRIPRPALCLAPHATQPLLSVGLTAGGLLLASATPPATSTVFALDAGVHATAFLSDRVVAGADSQLHLFDAARAAPLSSCALPDDGDARRVTALRAVDAHVCLAGDDAGGLHVVDTRCAAPGASLLEQADYISAIAHASHNATDAVLAASGDGSLCAYDMRAAPRARLKLMYASDGFQDDLLSLAVLPGHAVAGTLSGALNVYDLRFMDTQRESDAVEHVDRFYGHPECVNGVVEHDDIVVTASTDGIVRVVDVVRKALLGVLEYDVCVDERRRKGKKKKEEEAWPIEGMVSIAGWGRPVFGLLGHDDVVRFCDGKDLVDEDDDDNGDGEGESKKVEGEGLPERKKVEETVELGRRKKKRQKVFDKSKKASDFFDDL